MRRSTNKIITTSSSDATLPSYQSEEGSSSQASGWTRGVGSSSKRRLNKSRRHYYSSQQNRNQKQRSMIIGCLVISALAVIIVAVAVIVFRGTSLFSGKRGRAESFKAVIDNDAHDKIISNVHPSRRRRRSRRRNPGDDYNKNKDRQNRHRNQRGEDDRTVAQENTRDAEAVLANGGPNVEVSTSKLSLLSSLPLNSIYRLTVPDIQGTPTSLLQFSGMISLVVNVACA